MDHEVSVVLKNGERFNFPIAAGELAAIEPAAARHWIGEEFVKAGAPALVLYTGRSS